MFSVSQPSGTICKDGDAVADFSEYEAFLRAGGTPEQLQDERDPFPRIEVTAWQLIQALAEKGWLQDVEAAVAASNNPLVKYGWQRAPTFWSDHALSLALGAGIGKTRAEMHQLFELAKTK